MFLFELKSQQKVCNVKLCLQVPYPSHSHIIGRAGHNINAVMKETRTKIHFPDQNRIAGHKKSNQVFVIMLTH